MVEIRDEAATQGRVTAINFTGAGVTAAVAAGVATVTIAGGAGTAWTIITQDLGVARRSGTFDITGLSGLTADKPVDIMQTSGAISSKGNARDEPEMDMIVAIGYVLSTTSIRVYWFSPNTVVGTYEFAYMVGA